jgi:hypothetical protein
MDEKRECISGTSSTNTSEGLELLYLYIPHLLASFIEKHKQSRLMFCSALHLRKLEFLLVMSLLESIHWYAIESYSQDCDKTNENRHTLRCMCVS